MEKSIILTADVLDILFEYRNKSYGAYDLRKSYNKRMVYGLGGTFFLCLLFIVGTIVANAKKTDHANDVITNIELQNFKQEETKPEPPPVPPPKQEPPKVAIATLTPPKIVRDEEIKPDEEIKEVEKLENTKIGTVNQAGVDDDGVVAPPVEKSPRVAEAPKVEEDIDKIWITVQRAARFAGEMEGWRKFLERNLNSDIPSQNGAPPASYTVIVSFIVDRSGAISDVRAENDPGYGTKAEAMRVIQKSPRWEPAEQNGTTVIYRHKQSITFQVKEE